MLTFVSSVCKKSEDSRSSSYTLGAFLSWAGEDVAMMRNQILLLRFCGKMYDWAEGIIRFIWLRDVEDTDECFCVNV